jgi:hypothetical protein
MIPTRIERHGTRSHEYVLVPDIDAIACQAPTLRTEIVRE